MGVIHLAHLLHFFSLNLHHINVINNTTNNNSGIVSGGHASNCPPLPQKNLGCWKIAWKSFFQKFSSILSSKPSIWGKFWCKLNFWASINHLSWKFCSYLLEFRRKFALFVGKLQFSVPPTFLTHDTIVFISQSDADLLLYPCSPIDSILKLMTGG